MTYGFPNIFKIDFLTRTKLNFIWDSVNVAHLHHTVNEIQQFTADIEYAQSQLRPFRHQLFMLCKTHVDVRRAYSHLLSRAQQNALFGYYGRGRGRGRGRRRY